jgi:cyclopropane-fatty-acyl-phospholipid synthase
MDRLLRIAFERLIRAGNLRVSTSSGSTFTFGDGTGRPVAIRFTTHAAERRVLIDPELRFGEAYMDGGGVVEQGSIADFLDIAVRNSTRFNRACRTRRQAVLRRVFPEML